MSASSFDLAAYLRRIGHEGPVAADLATLRALHALHVNAIPFENLSPLLSEEIGLDAASLQRKLIETGRGGWCYEHNLAFRHVLEAIGFPVRGLAARVRWNAPEGVIRPRTHMLLMVAVQGEDWLADVGFGGLTLSAPLRFAPHLAQETPHEPFRIEPEGTSWLLQARLEDAWQTLYVFDLQEQHLADYALASWYLAHHPESMFLHNLLAARTAPGARHVLFNSRYTCHRPDGSQTRMLAGVDEMKRLLEQVFLLRLPDHPGLDERLARFFELKTAPDESTQGEQR
jgi:N-hydroxyarylamine O-acetyltransferase